MGQPMKKTEPWPQYRSHKIVKAMEVESIEAADGGAVSVIKLKNSEVLSLKQHDDLILRYHPKVGDFLVEYADGYRSFSPRKAFLEGYTKVSQVNTSEELQKLLDDDVDQTITVHGDGSVSRADGFNEPDHDLQAQHGNPAKTP